MEKEFWIEHSCGCWKIGMGDEIGRIVFKTSNMGTSITNRQPLNEGSPDIVTHLIKANAKQFGIK